MAAIHRTTLCTCFVVLLLSIVTLALSPCKKEDFKEYTSPCDPQKGTKKIVYYMYTAW